VTAEERAALTARILADFAALDEDRRAELVDHATALLAEQRA
jgi:hypothetical protein